MALMYNVMSYLVRDCFEVLGVILKVVQKHQCGIRVLLSCLLRGHAPGNYGFPRHLALRPAITNMQGNELEANFKA